MSFTHFLLFLVFVRRRTTVLFPRIRPYYANPIVGPFTGGYCASGVSNKYLVLEQIYQDATCGTSGNGPSAVNAILLNRCVLDSTTPTTIYKMATFIGQPNYRTGAQQDSFGALTIQAYSEIFCNNVIAGNVGTLSVPMGVKGSVSSGLLNYWFKGGYYFFDDYSKLQATITNTFGAGTILGTYSDSSCTTVNTGTNIGGGTGGLTIMVSYYNNAGICALNIATTTSLKTTCSGPTDGVTDTSASSGSTYGALTGSITLFSDSNCATVSQAATTYTTPGFCWSSTGTGSSNVVASVGPFTSGFCQVQQRIPCCHTRSVMYCYFLTQHIPCFSLSFSFPCS